MQILPSLLSCPLFEIPENLRILETHGIETFHIDVMDGTYVPQLTYGTLFIQEVRKLTQKTLDVHLMVSHPERIAGDFIAAGANTLTFHPDTVNHPYRLLRSIQGQGCEVGIVIDPHVSIQSVIHLLEVCQEIVIMTVNPGFAGQEMIKSSLNKCLEIKDFCTNNKIPCPRIVCDGGIHLKNFEEVKNQGFDGAIIGSALFSGESLINTIHDFNQHNS